MSVRKGKGRNGGRSKRTLVLELLRRNVRLTPAQSLAQMRRLLPAHPKHIAHSKIRNLDMALRVNQEVLGLDIAVRDAHAMEVRDASEDLLEVRVDLGGAEVAFFDGGVEVPTRTVLHDLAPVLLLVLDEVDRLDDVVAAREEKREGRESQ